MERRLPRLFPPFKLHATLLALLALALAVAALGPRARAQERRSVDETPQSRVFGRIVDSKGAAVRGAKVELRAIELPWRPGEPRESFETSSDDSGQFELTVPTPTSEGVVLTVRSGRYLDIATLGFGPAGGRGELRLKVGDNDVRTLTLEPAGALTGRVTDERDQPISGALVRLADKLPRDMERQTRSNARGEFELAHVPVGTYTLEALADGFRGAKVLNRAVVADKTTAGVDLMLFHAKTISGVVVDENGVGVANARVWGCPKYGGRGAGARTDADGRFVVRLLQNEPHRFDVEAEGFAKLDSSFEELERRELAEGRQVEQGSLAAVHRELRGYYEPGSTDVRLVLDRPALTRFVVLDAATSAPVPEFALTLEWKPIGVSSRKGGEPKFLRDVHPNGEFECEADPRRHTYLIVAPGYAPARGAIVHEPADTRRCVVRLSKGGSLTGQVLVGGKPVEGADVILRETTLEELYEEPVADENQAYWWELEGVFDPFWIDETRRKMRSDAEGRFRFESLDAGDYRLEIKTKLGDRRSMEPVKIALGVPLDLGNVELLRAATLQGRVLVPPGTSPAKLQISASVFDVTRFATTDALGQFRIPALPAGRAHVHISDEPGVLARFRVQQFELAPDETKDVLLDATGSVGASVSIVARIDGKPAVGLDVCAVSVVDPTLRARLGRTRNLGATKEWIPAIGECSVEFLAPSGMPVARLPKAAQLILGAEVKLDIDLAVGQLAFEWPTLLRVERLRLVEFEGRHSGRSELVRVDARPDDSVRDADLAGLSDQRCEFLWVQPGECEWTVRVISSSATNTRIERRYRRSATVVAGALAECLLKPEDQIEVPEDRR